MSPGTTGPQRPTGAASGRNLALAPGCIGKRRDTGRYNIGRHRNIGRGCGRFARGAFPEGLEPTMPAARPGGGEGAADALSLEAGPN